MASEIDIAWAAGLFEGEGFLTRRLVGSRVYLEMGIEMRDRDIVERFVAIIAPLISRAHRANGVPRPVSGIRVRKRSNPLHSDMCCWKTNGNTGLQAYAILRPYLGERRRAQGDAVAIEAALIRAEALAPRKCVECGAEFSVQDFGHARQFCSKLCYGRARRRLPGAREAAKERQLRYKERQRALRPSGPLGKIDPGAPA